jgi:hypothetical protein
MRASAYRRAARTNLRYGMDSAIARANTDIRVQGGTIWALLCSVRKPHCLGGYRRKDRETGPAMVGEKMAEN